MQEPKIEEVKDALNSETGRALEQYFKSRQRSRKEMDLRRVARTLKERGYNINLAEIMSEFKGLENLGLGHLISDKKRFKWDYSFVSLAKALQTKEALQPHRAQLRQFSAHVQHVFDDGNGEAKYIIIRKDAYEIAVPLEIDDASLTKLIHILERLDHAVHNI